MNGTDAATIYTRQSLDATGEGLAVDRQLLACRQLCADQGWTVAQVFSDNDISATTGKHRPGFEALLKSDPVRIVVWHMDRLVRLSKELERVIDLNVNVHAVASGHIDLSNPAGRAVAKTVTAWAQYEGEQKSRRQLASNEQAAKAGRRVGGRRPFGFDDGGMELAGAEAEAVRDGYDKLLGGVPLAEIARDWNASGFVSGQPNRKGEPSPFRADSVRTILENGRNAGLRIYKGEIMAKAIWPAIVSEETWRAAVALLSDPKRRSGPRGNARALLTGVAVCGVCGAHCHSGGAARPGHPAYRCSGSRGHIARMTGPIDAYVTRVVLARLARPDAKDLVTVTKGPSVAALRTEEAALRSRLEALALNFADGVVTESQLRAATTRTRGNLAAVEGKLGDLGRVDVLGPLMGAHNTQAVWDAMSLSARRAVIGTLMKPVIYQVGRGVRTFRPESIGVVWHDVGRAVGGNTSPS
jgi:site-specific DNA recombinase